ncbi:MAG: hypothetical protein ACR2OJ_05290, partial [Hyphomicrobiales bacterium]
LKKSVLVEIAKKIRDNERLDVSYAEPFLHHKFQELSSFSSLMLKFAAILSLFFASVLVIFPEVGEKLIEILPGYFLLPERLAKALDYVWGLVGKPVGKRHLMYHLPNIIIYAFGVAGVRLLWKKVYKNNWKDQVRVSQEKLRGAIKEGTARFRFVPGFSVLFVGEGDQIARSLVMDEPDVGVTIASTLPAYTNFWGRFSTIEGEEGFRRVLDQVNTQDAGEYVLFPVTDEHLFLPGPHEYDIAPHRVELAVRRIRAFEQEQGWDPKRIVIVGDQEQKSRFITTSRDQRIDEEDDDVSLRTITQHYENIKIIDPTDTTLRKIIEIANGRHILFRSSDQGFEKYSTEFYHRLSLLKYEPSSDETLTVGYDISDLETEHQIISRTQIEYLPVILSREIFDALISNHLREGTYIFVPRLVKRELQKIVAEQ